MPEDKDDKLLRRYEILEKLLSFFSHGQARIKWADKTIIEIEEIEVKNNKITK
jgi:hypothetical protein